MLYLIAYDIADPKRLRRVARLMERHAVRCQKSVFVLRGGREDVERVLALAGPLLDPAEDVVQAWQLAAAETAGGLAAGTPLPCRPAAAVCVPGSRPLIAPPSS